MTISTVFLLIYIVLCIVGLHVAINYLCLVHANRPLRGKDYSFALICIFFNVLVLIGYKFADTNKQRKQQAQKENYEQSVQDLKNAISVYIPYFDKKRYTVAALINSGNPYAYLLGKHLLDSGKASNYTLTEQDIYDHGHKVTSANKVDIVNAKYAQERLNKREL